jgi:hypothetical protein
LENNDYDQLCKTYWDIWERVQMDPEYACMLEELKELEPLYESVLGVLTREQSDLIDRIAVLRETMGRRALEFACEEILNLKEEP